MAFVTEYTFGSLANTFELRDGMDYITKEFFVAEIYPDSRLFSLFNQYNLKKLYIYKFLLENHKELEAYDFVEIRQDTRKYVFDRGGRMKYHLFEDCETINSTYKDYIIPEEVRERDLVDEFRNWFVFNKFKEKDNSGEQILELMTFKYNSGFAKKHNLSYLNRNYELIVTKLNTGGKEVDYSFDINVFKERINTIIQERYNICSSITMMYLGNYDYLFKKFDREIETKIMQLSQNKPDLIGDNFIQNYGIENLKSFFKIHHKLKTEAFQLLANYFRWTYNLDKINFNEYTLQHFGLVCCKVCSRKKL